MRGKILSLLMALSVLLSAIPGTVLAEGTVDSVTVSFTAQMENGFLCAPQTDTCVRADLAETYGFTDKVTEGVSALDVLVRTHELVFGEETFTPETATGFLEVNEYSYITTVFGVETSNCGFAVNGAMPHDNELYGGYYTGYAVDSAQVQDKDFIEFFLYQDEYGLDQYIWFEQNGIKLRSLAVPKGETATLTVSGYAIGWYGCMTQESIAGVVTPAADVQVCLVDAESGALTDLEAVTADEQGRITLPPFAAAGHYLLSAYMPADEIENNDATPVLMPLLPVTVADACITVPADAALFVGSKVKHFMPFTEIAPILSVTDDSAGTTAYYFDLQNNKQYHYRVSGEAYITNGGVFKKTPDYGLTLTAEDLSPRGVSKTTLDRDPASNNGYNVADIYLNINAAGYLTLAAPGDTYQVVPLRHWEPVNNTADNYFVEPDYHYTVVDEAGRPCDSVVNIDKDGLITAVGAGTAIVLVTYDAIQVPSAVGGPFFGALWPENTGVFVVSVSAADSGIDTGMTLHAGLNSRDSKTSGDAIDAEHDVIYFIGEQGSYTFTPMTPGCTVSVANPTVDGTMHFSGFCDVAADVSGAFTVPLREGRNIVRLTKDGKSTYQLITAKGVSVTVNNGEPVYAGDSVSLVFDRLYHPANKLAGVYNMSALPVYRCVSGYEDKLVGGLPAQYNFASHAAAQTVANVLKETQSMFGVSYQKEAVLTVPQDFPYDTFTLSEGMLCAVGYGDPYGNHRGITLTEGKAPNLNGNQRVGWLGSLPDIEIPVTATTAALQAISLSTEGVKTAYYAGDAFDTANLVVTAAYEDGATQLATNYTVSPAVLTEETAAVTITYRGKTAQLPVRVAPLAVTGLAVTTPPIKTAYTAGEVFDPTGMVVTATYNNGSTAAVTAYSYAPGRALQAGDTAMTVTYTGQDAAENLPAAIVPITVTASGQGGSGSRNLTVYLTLYGDDNHGEATGTAHTYKARNLTSWLAETAVTVPQGSCVIDVISRALGLAGIPYENPSGSYIESVKGLSEKDNGPLSGWMYILNNRYPSLSTAEQTVQNGDRIIFHYTDDYTQEKIEVLQPSGNSGSTGSGKGHSGRQTGNQVPDPTQAPTAGIRQFGDVPADSWYAAAIGTACAAGWMRGVSADRFEPEANITRGMLVTLLHRLEGEPAAEDSGFSDVAADAYYSRAVAWAGQNGLVSGLSEEVFAPDVYITREQLAAVLFRYAAYKAYDTATRQDLTKFADRGIISPWAHDAMAWAGGTGLLNGRSDSLLAPDGTATRGETAVIFVRFAELFS